LVFTYFQTFYRLFPILSTPNSNKFFLLIMKTAILFALPLAVSAAVIAPQVGNAVAPVAGVDKLTPVLKPTAQRTLTKFGRQYRILSFLV
jgi:hypothetical protein